MAAPAPAPARRQHAVVLLGIVERLVAELHPQRDIRVGLDADFERDLALDSLARTELLARIERELDVSLPSSLLAEANTPRDLLDAMGVADAVDAARPSAPIEAGAGVRAPIEVRTLDEALLWHADRQPDRPHVVLVEDDGSETTITYGALAAEAAAVAEGLVGAGLPPGGRVAIMLPTSVDFFVAYAGALLAGGVPVPIYPPLRRAQLEAHLRRQAAILANAGARILVTTDEARMVAKLLASQVVELGAVETVASLRTAVRAPAVPTRDEQAIAMLQYTSGSTGMPKGVVLTHANLLANIRAMGAAAEVGAEDRVVSWLPLYHDMGLIGSWLACLYFAIPTVIMSPLSFLGRPTRWMKTIDRHRATISPAPNFGFELCLRRFDPKEYEGIDLSCLRMLPNGAEPVSASTIRRFTEAFAPFGLRASAVAPVYGLAENAVGLAFPPPGREPPIDRVSRTELARTGRARPTSADAPDVREVVACGRPLPGHEIRVVDESGRELPERVEGEVQFRGPSSTSGYHDNPEATARLFDGTWLRTGDRGYVANGDIHITGRSKDLVIRAGRNIHPHEVEQLVGELPGVRRGCVAAFGATDPVSGTERLVIVAETREAGERCAELHREIVAVTHDLLGGPPDDVVLAPPGAVAKTSSGKIRRAATREAYEAGRLGPRSRALWWQVVRLFVSGVGPRLQRATRKAAGLAYAAWWWTTLLVPASLAWVFIVLLPRPQWRWAAFRAAGRAHLWLAGTPPRVRGTEHVPASPCIFVCNHASYLDALVLGAALPGRFAFAVKGELRDAFVTRVGLSRLGARFVDRFDAERGAQAARGELREAVEAGERLLVFAEGTLTRRPGIAQFRLGAFVLACETGVPIVPVVLQGTRSVLRDGQWYPHRAPIAVTIAEPIFPEGTSWEAAVRLRDRVRATMLAISGEPDLAREEHPLVALRRELAAKR